MQSTPESRACAKLQCTGVRVACTGVQDTNPSQVHCSFAHACCQPVLHSNPEQSGINKTAVHWCQGCLHRCVECKPPRVQLQRHMPALPVLQSTPECRACASAVAPVEVCIPHTCASANPDTSALQFCFHAQNCTQGHLLMQNRCTAEAQAPVLAP